MENIQLDKKVAVSPSAATICSLAPCDTRQFLSLPVGTEFLWLDERFTKINETEARFDKTGDIWDSFGGTK